MLEQNLTALKQGTELFRKVYGNEISEEMFYHKHFDNPDCLPVPYIIEAQNDTPVAMRWLMKAEFLYGGQTLHGVQSSDDAVLDEARGLLFLKMRKKTLNILKQENIDFEYGCFYPGNAMDIAEKCGEKNVVNLYMARLFVNEKIRRWKRFNIYVPCFVRSVLSARRIKKLKNIANKDLTLYISEKCPFTSDDYAIMNAGDSLHIERNQDYYDWKTSYFNYLKFITVREGDNLRGFLIVKYKSDCATVVDWDAFGDDRVGTLAAMLLSICEDYQYIDIPSLNVENGEMKLFTDLGCKDMSRLWAPVCICAKPINDIVTSIIEDAKNWKHRLIDADYFLNGE